MKLKCDLHLHSTLSCCASRENTPTNLVNMSKVCGSDIIAICDHNAWQNAIAASETCGSTLVLFGIEVTTSEDIHVLCYFERQSDVEAFFAVLMEGFLRFPLSKKLFFDQEIMDKDGNVVEKVEFLLSRATSKDIYEVVKLARENNGVAVPAHVDREGSGILSALGEIPDDLGFCVVEVSKACPEETKEKLKQRFAIIQSSDAHCLEDVPESGVEIELRDKSLKSIMEFLRTGKQEVV